LKAFRFRLDQVRRWREVELTLQKARTAAATARAVEACRDQARVREAIAASAADLQAAPTREALMLWPAYRDRADRAEVLLEKRVADTERAVDEEMRRLREARRRLRLLENLRESARAIWTREVDREIATFVDEAHLTRSRKRS
jgi:hypothetical protein